MVQRKQAHVGRVDGIECWEEADASTFCVRGRDYMQTRTKVPSAPAVYRRVRGLWPRGLPHMSNAAQL